MCVRDCVYVGLMDFSGTCWNVQERAPKVNFPLSSAQVFLFILLFFIRIPRTNTYDIRAHFRLHKIIFFKSKSMTIRGWLLRQKISTFFFFVKFTVHETVILWRARCTSSWFQQERKHLNMRTRNIYVLM